MDADSISPESSAGNDVPTLWSACVERLSEVKLFELANWRGYSPAFCARLATQGRIGLHHYRDCPDCWAFPNIDIEDGEIVSIHCRIEPRSRGAKAKWYYDPSGRTIHPLITGRLENALFIGIGESQWDLLALEDRLGEAAANWVFIATRSATGAQRLSKVSIPKDTDIYLFPQSDTAGQKWIDNCLSALDRSARVVSISGHKDLNEWAKNGLTADLLKAAIDSSIVRLPPEKPAQKPKAERQEKIALGLEKQAGEVAATLEAYYDQIRKEYVVRTPGGIYQSLNETQFKRVLRFRGLDEKRIVQRHWSQTDIVIREIQQKNYVQYVGALAGRNAGFYHENGIRFVVTDSPRVIEPQKGSWSTIESFLKGLIWDDVEPYSNEQQAVFLGWLQVGYKAFLARKFQPGQALAIAGPVEAGKSLLQLIITESLGGRSRKAALFLQGRTDFNGELFEAEHLILEDEAASTRHPERVALGVAIKNLVANRIQACHAKQRQIVNLAPWWRVSISLNDEPERLLVLPPSLNQDMADKVILLRASLHPMPMVAETAEEKEKFWQTLQAELPAFLYSLVNEFKIPEGWHNTRFGVRAWQHPSLLSALEELSPAIALLELIDRGNIWQHGADGIFQPVGTIPWEGTALALRAQLLATTSTQRDAERLLNWTNAAGAYLNELVRIRGARVQRQKTSEERIYLIFPQ